MDVDMEEELEDEYAAAQQNEIVDVFSTAVGEKHHKKIEADLAALLLDVNEMLYLLNEQMIRLNEVTKTIPETVDTLKITITALQCISDDLPIMVKNQCLNEYKKVFDNAVKNYNQMQKAVEKWQKSIGEKQGAICRIIIISTVLTPILLLFNLLFK